MISCPSSEQLLSLLEDSIPVDDENHLSSHLETCESCHVRWLVMTGDLLADQEAAISTQTTLLNPFLERLQQNVPAELMALVKDKKPSTIQFPGPPTSLGKLGQLEHFHIQHEIGQGATGIVYLAWDEKLNRQVALKVLRPESLTSELARTRFEREARTASSVQNEHIIKVYDFRTLPNQLPYIVMDYVEGESLTQLLERDISIDPPLAARIVLQVAQGLSAAHRQGLVHRDIKPSNILLKSEDSSATLAPKTTIVITDFGLARTTAVQAHDPRGRLTFSGETIGTPEYMSPEQISHPDSIDQRSDLFSVGVVLFEMLTGKLPFQGASLPDTFRVIRFEEPHTPRQLNTKVPRDLETICLKCLEKDPQNRFPSAAALAEELECYLSGKPILSRPVGYIEHLWRWSRRNPKLAVAGGVAAAALVATMIIAIAFALYESRTSREFQLRAATLTFDKGLELCEKGDAGQGMLWFARSYEMAPPDAVDLRRLIQANLNGWYQQLCPLQVFVEQEAAVLAVAFDKDGTTFATGDRSGMVRRYETATGQPIGVPLPHDKAVFAIAFSPDGKKLLTGCADNKARLWDVETGMQLNVLDHKAAVFAVGFGPLDCNTMFTGSYDRTVKVWNVSSGKPQGDPLQHEESVYSLDISSDGKLLITGTENVAKGNGYAYLWDLQSRQQLIKPIEHPGIVRAVAFHPKVKSFVTGTEKEALIWNTANPTRPIGDPLRHGAPVRSLTYSSDGNSIVTASDDRTVRLWRADTGKSIGALLRHADIVRGVAFHPKTSMILSGSEDKSVRLWSASSLMDQRIRLQHQDEVTSIALNQDGSKVVCGDRKDTAILWDTVKGTAIGGPLKHNDEITAVAFDPLYQTFATGSYDTTFRLWNAQTTLSACTVKRMSAEVTCIAYSPSGGNVTAATSDGKLNVWDTNNFQVPPVEIKHEKSITALVFSSDNSLILTASNDRTAKVWNRQTGKCLVTFTGHTGPLQAAAISPDGKTVLTGSVDKTARLWNAETGEILAILPHDGSVLSTEFNHDGSLALTASKDNTARLWEVASAKPRGAPLQHSGTVRRAIFHPGRHLILTGSEDATVRLWDVATTKAVGPAFRHTNKILVTELSHDGSTIAAASGNDVWIWKVSTRLKQSNTNLNLWAKILSCIELDEYGLPHPMTGAKWKQYRGHLDHNHSRSIQER